MLKILKLAVTLAVAALVHVGGMTSPAWSQVVQTSLLAGRVADSSGAVIQQAEVTLRGPQVRQSLRKLLVDRVVFTPRTEHYEFVGPWTLGKLVSGVVDLPQGMASPTGPELNFALPPLNEVVGWLERLETLRKTG